MKSSTDRPVFSNKASSIISPRTIQAAKRKMHLTSNEWLTKKYFLEVENRTTNPIIVADALSTILM